LKRQLKTSTLQKDSALLKRVLRHTAPATLKKFHWHIDYLLAAPNVLVKKTILIPAIQTEECITVELMKKYPHEEILKFGCSDCDCDSHLFYFYENPPF
jgi:Uri superfamily endonuclease